MAAYLALLLIPVTEAIGMIAGVVAIGCCWVLLFTRNSDEFTRALWNSAASFAFASMLVMMIILPFIEGFYDGFTGAEKGGPTVEAIIGCAIIAFYAGLLWKTIRGGT